MRKGKLPEQVLIRSVLKNVNKRRVEVLSGADPGQGYAAIKSDSPVMVSSMDTMTLNIEDICRHTIVAAANGIASAGGQLISAQISAVLPEDIDEKEIKRLSRQAESTCRELGIEAVGGHTSLSGAVSCPVITVTCLGDIKTGKVLSIKDIRPGDDIVMTKDIALEATAILVKEKEDILEKRFSPDFLYRAGLCGNDISVLPESIVASEAGVHAMYDLSDGGVFAGLWKIASGSGCGFTVDIKDIPVRQESIEICEYFDLNPYMILSAGAMLIVTDDGEGFCQKLSQAGIGGAVIGKMNSSNDKIIKNGEETRYLDKPQMDEIHKVI